MKFVLDAHTHTVASGHAYSTFEENAQHAIDKGLELIAITDHSPSMPGSTHEYYFSNIHIIPDEVTSRDGQKKIRLLKGVELNIIDYDGTVDLDKSIVSNMELVIASLHPPCIRFGNEEENTRALIRAMENKLINIIGHPGDPRYPIDIPRVVKASIDTGCILEINNMSLNPKGFRAGGRQVIYDIVRLCKKYKQPLIVGSDAHSAYNVGDFGYASALLEESGITQDLILNTSVELFLDRLNRHRATD